MVTSMTLRYFWIGIFWFAMAVVIALFLGYQNIPKLFEIVKSDAQAVGKVTRTDCENHSSI